MSFEYNSSGLRTKKVVGDKTIEYYYSGDLLVAQYDGEYLVKFIYDPSGEAIGFVYSMVFSDGEVLDCDYCYYVKNLQGDITGIYSMFMEIFREYTYDAWGNITGVYNENGNPVTDLDDPAYINPLRYRGYYYDDESGLYYLNSRYYNPEWGTFISADTSNVLDIQRDLYDKNLYAYCDNNPIIRKDSEGYYWNVIIGAVLGGGINLISNAIEGGCTPSEILISVVCGAVSGGFAATGFGGVAGQMLVGGLSSAIETGVKNYRKYNEKNMSLKEAIIGTVVDAGLGATFATVGFEGTGALKKSNQIVKKTHQAIKNYTQKTVHPIVKSNARSVFRQSRSYIVRTIKSSSIDSVISFAANKALSMLFSLFY